MFAHYTLIASSLVVALFFFQCQPKDSKVTQKQIDMHPMLRHSSVTNG